MRSTSGFQLRRLFEADNVRNRCHCCAAQNLIEASSMQNESESGASDIYVIHEPRAVDSGFGHAGRRTDDLRVNLYFF
jgi:hypothetical protein